MTVVVLRLTGLRGDGADGAVRALLADHGAYPDLSRLLVVDDTVALTGHSGVYERLLTSRRLDHLLCVAVGPRADHSRELRFPGNIGGGQGSVVLWVGDPNGVDWQLTGSTIAMGHSGNSASGLHHLVELLSVEEIFDRVCEVSARVPGGVASPGLRLAGADDETASFAAALIMAIRRATEPGLSQVAADSRPFTGMPGARPGTAGLAADGELTRCHENVNDSVLIASDAVRQLAGIAGLLGAGQPNIPADITDVGTTLIAFRDRVARLLRDAHAPGGLSEKQRGQVRAAGVRLPDRPSPAAGGTQGNGTSQTAEINSGRSLLVNRAIAEAVHDGETLPRVSRRLSLTASAMDHGGSASYLPQVDHACPRDLADRLTGPPPPPRPWRWWPPAALAVGAVLGVAAAHWSVGAGVAAAVGGLVIFAGIVAGAWRARISAWRGQLALDEAVGAADALAALVTKVAAQEWSGGAMTASEITLARIALDGVSEQLTEHADAAGDPGGGARAARLSESLLPKLHDLALAVLAADSVTASASGREAFEKAKAKTAELLAGWAQYARDHGALARPPFATSTAYDIPYADTGEVSEITEAIRHDPRTKMWQLCTAADLSALDAASLPQVVAFAPRLTREPLAEVVPPETIWTSSGAHAGLLRLVPLRPGIASPSWRAEPSDRPL
jgi:hypothetical protein